jgi:multiple sugar transport system substrate-binding protein
MKRSCFILLALVMPFVFTACGDGNPKEAENPQGDGKEVKTAEPVHLTLYNWGNLSDEEYQRLVIEPLKKKYPHITLDQIKRGTGSEPKDLVVAGNFPDLIVTNNDTLTTFRDLDLLSDITPQLKMNKLDVNLFEKAGLDRSKIGNELIGLPFNINYQMLYYNKDIFDKFGVPYPKDGMTMEDMIKLSKLVTRNDQGIQYRGFDPQTVYSFKNSLPIDLVDPQTDRASVNTDEWKYVLTLFKEIVTYPGNQQKGTTAAAVINGFVKDRTVAMTRSNGVIGALEEAMKSGFNWDMVQGPSFQTSPNISGDGQTTVLAISKSSKHKDEAMKVIEVMTSDEVQMISSKQYANRTVLKNQQIKAAFGAEVEYLKGKNVAGIFKSQPAEYRPPSPYSASMRPILNAKLQEFIDEKKDVNTALREAEEEMNKLITSLKSK